MMSEKRFECVFIEDDDFGLIQEKLKDNETNMTYCICDVADLLNFQDTQIRILKEEKNYLQKRFEAILKELYCKDRKLEELGLPLECCDKDE